MTQDVDREVSAKAFLSRVLEVAKAFEAAYRPAGSVDVRVDARPLVLAGHMVRAINLGDGILATSGNPIQNVLLRVAAELDANLAFIFCEKDHSMERALAFFDFGEVSRLQLHADIGRTLHLASEAETESIRSRIEGYKPQFFRLKHEPSGDGKQCGRWDWDVRDFRSRLETAASKEPLLTGRLSRSDFRRGRSVMGTLFRETNDYVHSGMISLLEGMGLLPVLGGNKRPSPTLLGANWLVDFLALCTRILNCSDFDERIGTLIDEGKALVKRWRDEAGT